MREDLDEEKDDFLEKNKEFKPVFEREFEPMDETCENEDEIDIFEPIDENYNVNKTLVNQFEPHEYNSKPNYTAENYNRISEKEVAKTHQKLYNDGKQKECGLCHKLKPIDEYGTRMRRGKKILLSKCRKCSIDTNQIYKYNNKVKIIQNAYNGNLKGKCQTCSADIKKLPALEFHHLDPKLKSGKGISMSRNWEETKKQVEKEKATILCENCHTKQRSKYYNKHIKIIQENNLSPLASNNQIS